MSIPSSAGGTPHPSRGGIYSRHLFAATDQGPTFQSQAPTFLAPATISPHRLFRALAAQVWVLDENERRVVVA